MAAAGTTLYFEAFGVRAELFQAASNRWNEYLLAGSAPVGVRFVAADETVTARYFHTDHLGSIAVITDEAGAVAERDSYDAWGKRRFASGADDTAGAIVSQTTRGYTGHEELDDAGLIHMNGRVYDPLVGRMMSADPFVPDPMNGQAWNRYSYVVNNPLSFTDPDGYCFLGLCGIGKAISSFFGAIGGLFRAVPILGDILKIVAVAACMGNPVCGVIAAAATSAFVAGVTSGNLGAALKAGAIAAASAIAFYAVGNMTDAIAGTTGHAIPEFGSPAHVFNIAGHAAVGCGMSVASGGNCGSGALADGITSFVGPMIKNADFGTRLAVNTVLGGTASVIGGGSFANGAVTGAFGYLFNACARTPSGKGCGFGAEKASDMVEGGGSGGGSYPWGPLIAGAVTSSMSSMSERMSDGIASIVHGNSLSSNRQTYVYQLEAANGDVLKYGITSESDPQDRYTRQYYASTGAEMRILAQYPWRSIARADEFSRCAMYTVANGRMPPLSGRC